MRTETEPTTPPIVFKYKNPTGLIDILPESQRYWRHAEATLTRLASDFGFRRVITPPVDARSLYKIAFGNRLEEHLVECGISEGVEKYVFRAHPRLGLIRSFKENGLSDWPPPIRTFTQVDTIEKKMGNFENRHYFCLDVFGAKDTATTTNIFFLIYKLANQFKLKSKRLIIYSNGCDACRPTFNKAFGKYCTKYKNQLCGHCQQHLSIDAIYACSTDNTFEWIENAPSLLDHLCENCHTQLTNILEMCDSIGIEYDVDPISFSTHPEAEQTTFGLRLGEERLPAIIGFSYDKVASAIVDKPTMAIGVTVDLQLLSQYLEDQKASLPEHGGVQVFVAQLGQKAKFRCVPLLQQLFNAGYCVVTAGENDGISQQLLVAERLKAQITLIMGQKEAVNGHVILRDMIAGTQDDVIIEDLIPTLNDRLATYANVV